MRQTSGNRKGHGEKIIKDIRRTTRRQYLAEEKIRIVLDGLKGEDSIAELCRREGSVQSVYYKRSKERLEAGKKRLVDDTAREAQTRIDTRRGLLQVSMQDRLPPTIRTRSSLKRMREQSGDVGFAERLPAEFHPVGVVHDPVGADEIENNLWDMLQAR